MATGAPCTGDCGVTYAAHHRSAVSRKQDWTIGSHVDDALRQLSEGTGKLSGKLSACADAQRSALTHVTAVQWRAVWLYIRRRCQNL